ncbi:HIRAN domain-containing protein [Riemerella anatipestifer]|uniref:HIRAN domain-containing protein n=1 Tax=Riemerella anatipestifer TaxID=34085 RepID=UPI0030ECC5D4
MSFIGFVIVFVIVVSIYYIYVGYSSEGNTNDSKKDTNTIDVDIPHPVKSHPIKVFQYLEKTRAPYLGDIYYQLEQQGLFSDYRIKDAFREKLDKGTLNGARWRDKLTYQELKDFYDEEIPNYNYVTTFAIAGVSHENRMEYIEKNCFVGDELKLVPEPDNPHDKKAIKILFGRKKIGYVPSKKCIEVLEIIQKGYILKIDEIIKDGFVNVFVSLYESESILPKLEKEPSYKIDNPDEIVFLSDLHRREITQEEIAELQSRKIDRKYYYPKKDVEDTSSVFYKKKVVITGKFTYFPDRNNLAKLLYDVGADIDTSVTEKVEYVIAGEDAGWRKLEKAEEFGIEIINEDKIIEIFKLKI